MTGINAQEVLEEKSNYFNLFNKLFTCSQNNSEKQELKPDISECNLSGSFEYILSGCSCLSGDIFGTYRFKNQLNVGSKITFKNVGAYSMVKANMFNGINLPDIYCIKSNNQWQKIRNYTFNDYLSYCGG